MEFVDEESRPRFQIQSSPATTLKNTQKTPKSKLHILTCISFSFLLLSISFKFFSDSQTLTFFLVWFSLSLLIAPFAPSSLTGGDPTVGAGPTLPDPVTSPLSDSETDRAPRRSRARKPDNPIPIPQAATIRFAKPPEPRILQEVEVKEEKEWGENDFDILKKHILKHPVGEPQRWEKITEAFEGRHKVESVIKMGKSLGERKVGDKDSFAQFLKQRKPVDKRVDSVGGDENGEVGKTWNSIEDIALLNALKAFPKDAAMRWEKVAAAVTGRTKGECVKRVAELKKGFRSSKGAES